MAVIQTAEPRSAPSRRRPRSQASDLSGEMRRELSRRHFLSRSGHLGLLAASGGWLAACGSGGSTGSATGVSGPLRLMKSAYEPDDAAHLRKAVAPFVREHPRVRLNVSTFPAASMDTYLTTTYAGPDPADVIILPSPLWPRFAAAGALADLSGRIKSAEFKPDYAHVLPQLWQSVDFHGKTYAIPYVGAIFPTWVNLDLLEQAGHRDWQASYASMLAAAKAVRKGDTYGFAMATSYKEFSYYWWLPYIWQAGADLYDAEATEGRLLNADSPAAWGLLAELFQSGAAPQPGQYDYEGLKALFVAGRLAILPYSTDLTSALVAAKVKFRWAQTFGPPGPQGQAMAADYDCLTVSSKSKNQNAAWELVRYMSEVPSSSEYLTSFGFQLLGARNDQPQIAAKDRYIAQIVHDFVPKSRAAPPSPKLSDCLQAACAEFERCVVGKPAERALKDANDAVTQLLKAS